jgi:hypothetical protein
MTTFRGSRTSPPISAARPTRRTSKTFVATSHLAASDAGVPTLNQTISTLRFFFKVTLGRPDIVERTAFVHEPSKLPVVLSPEEVARLLDAARHHFRST